MEKVIFYLIFGIEGEFEPFNNKNIFPAGI
jgi:hypothetical protein